jgi:hypothetical protein
VYKTISASLTAVLLMPAVSLAQAAQSTSTGPPTAPAASATPKTEAMPMAAPALPPAPAWPVSGIYTTGDTKDLGALLGSAWLKGVKIRGWVDVYYEANFNDPSLAVAATNNASAIKAQNLTIEGRTFDVHDRSLTLSLAEVEIEKVPETGGVGFKIDFAVGDTQEIMVNTIRAKFGPPAAGDYIEEIDKIIQHASVSYVAPVGRGLRFDFGKFVTHIGGETIETVKNWNYSHSFFYSYGIPFQDNGLHVSYPWSDSFYTDLWVLSGWNNTIDNNKVPSIGGSIGWTISPTASLYVNYLGGPELPNDNSDLRHLIDSQLNLGAFGPLNAMVNFDYGSQSLPSGSATSSAKWWGVTGYLRYKISDELEPSVRIEYYDDSDGYTTGTAQKLLSGTLTLNTKLGAAKSGGGVLLIRPELRVDKSNVNFFTSGDKLASTETQVTLGAGVTYMF